MSGSKQDALYERLKRYIHGFMEHHDDRYDAIVRFIKDPEKDALKKDFHLLTLVFNILSLYTSRLDVTVHGALLDLIFSFDCRAPESCVTEWCHFMLSLCTISVNWLKPCLSALCRVLMGKYALELFKQQYDKHQLSYQKNLKSQNPPDTSYGLCPTTITTPQLISDENQLVDLDQLQHRIHLVIQEILFQVPISSGALISAMISEGPYYTAPLLQQCLWVHTLLRVCENGPTLRDSLLTAILEKFLQLDLHISRSIWDVFGLLQNEYVANGINPELDAQNDSFSVISHDTSNNDGVIKVEIDTPPVISSTTTQEYRELKALLDQGRLPPELHELYDGDAFLYEMMLGKQKQRLVEMLNVNATDNNNLVKKEKRGVLEALFNKNDEMRNVDGLLTNLIRYLYLVSNSSDMSHDPDIQYMGTSQVQNISKTPPLFETKVEFCDVKKEIKSESLSTVKSETPSFPSKSPPTKTIVATMKSVELNQLKLNHSRLQHSIDTDVLSNSFCPNNNNHDSMIMGDSDPETPSNTLPPPLLLQSTSEVVQHDSEMTFQVDTILAQERGEVLETQTPKMGKNDKVLKSEQLDDLNEDDDMVQQLNTLHRKEHHSALISAQQQSQQTNTNRLNDDVFRALLTTFNRNILPSQGSHFIQWLLYYQLSFKFEYGEVLFRLLGDRFVHKTNSTTIKIGCLMYMASFIVRAPFLRSATALQALERISIFSIAYVDKFVAAIYNNHTTTKNSAGSLSSAQNAGANALSSVTMNPYSPENHTVFYMCLEALLYVATLRPDLFAQLRSVGASTKPVRELNKLNELSLKSAQKHQNNNNNNTATFTNAQAKIASRRSVAYDLDTNNPNNSNNANINTNINLASTQAKTQRLSIAHQYQAATPIDIGPHSPVFGSMGVPALDMASLPPLNSLPQSSLQSSLSPPLSAHLRNNNNTNHNTNLNTNHNTNNNNKQPTQTVWFHAECLSIQPSGNDPLHIVALLTSVLKPMQYLSPTLVERYMLFYHNTLSPAALPQSNFTLTPPQQQHLCNGQNSSQNDANSSSKSSSSSTPQSNPAARRSMKRQQLARDLFPAQSTPQLALSYLPSIYIPALDTTVGLSTILANNTQSLTTARDLFSKLSKKQNDVLLTYLQQQVSIIKPLIDSIPNCKISLNNLTTHVQLDPRNNKLLTLHDLQDHGMFPVLHAQSPLQSFARGDARPPTQTALQQQQQQRLKDKQKNKNTSKSAIILSTMNDTQHNNNNNTASTSLDDLTLSGEEIIILNSEALEEFQFGVPTLQRCHSFIRYPYDPFFPPSLRDYIYKQYNLSFESYQPHAPYYPTITKRLSLPFHFISKTSLHGLAFGGSTTPALSGPRSGPFQPRSGTLRPLPSSSPPPSTTTIAPFTDLDLPVSSLSTHRSRGSRSPAVTSSTVLTALSGGNSTLLTPALHTSISTSSHLSNTHHSNNSSGTNDGFIAVPLFGAPSISTLQKTLSLSRSTTPLHNALLTPQTSLPSLSNTIPPQQLTNITTDTSYGGYDNYYSAYGYFPSEQPQNVTEKSTKTKSKSHKGSLTPRKNPLTSTQVLPSLPLIDENIIYDDHKNSNIDIPSVASNITSTVTKKKRKKSVMSEVMSDQATNISPTPPVSATLAGGSQVEKLKKKKRSTNLPVIEDFVPIGVSPAPTITSDIEPVIKIKKKKDKSSKNIDAAEQQPPSVEQMICPPLEPQTPAPKIKKAKNIPATPALATTTSTQPDILNTPAPTKKKRKSISADASLPSTSDLLPPIAPLDIVPQTAKKRKLKDLAPQSMDSPSPQTQFSPDEPTPTTGILKKQKVKKATTAVENQLVQLVPTPFPFNSTADALVTDLPASVKKKKKKKVEEKLVIDDGDDDLFD